MKKLGNKWKLFKIMLSVFLSMVKFRLKVFWRKILRKNNLFSLDSYSRSQFNARESKLNKTAKILRITAALFLAAGMVLFFFFRAPANFPVGTMITIEKGESLRSVSLKLKDENIIRSRLAFEAMVIIRGGELHLMYSDYLFDSKLPVYEIARRVTRGEHHIPQIKVTIPEGFNNAEIADLFSAKLLAFDKDKFLADEFSKEGYLFPDTYFFFVTGNADDVLKIMTDNYEKKILSIRPEIALSGKTEKQIITMASIIEKEARGDADREIISGILWKRLSKDIPLQVDAAIETYKTKGLPDSPIANPGLKSIRAAIYPENSPYLYYLHDKDGNIHYARTFEEHRANIEKYLK